MKARQQTEKGMALVITLMMLAIVTFMAVVFLTISRRERIAVKTSEEQSISRMMADAGQADATANVIGNISKGAESYIDAQILPAYGNTNAQRQAVVDNGTIQRAKLHYSLNVSRNFINVNGFDPSKGTNPLNVAYFDKNLKGLTYGSADYMQMVANLQYNPRVPVIVNAGGTNEDFRFYLDLNRNGMFDPTGVYPMTTIDKQQGSAGNNFFVGDPEWIGVLERPDLPHSETNRFIGRYAYVILPEGKSLDINFIHNKVAGLEDDLNNNPVPGTNRFSRNQGVGFWEMNLAAFLVDFHNLNANTWPTNTYTYEINSGNGTAVGPAFRDALGLLGYRLNTLTAAGTPTRQSLYEPIQVFPPRTDPRLIDYGANRFWANDLVDLQGDGNYIHYQYWHTNDAPIKTKILIDLNKPDKRWFGLDQPDKTGEYPDVQRYFQIGSSGAGNANFNDFYKRFTNAVSSTRTNSYDRYAYYRFIGQMGADSVPAIQGRIHLNYTNEPGSISTNLFPWVYATNAPLYSMPTPIGRPNYWETNQNGVFERQTTLTNFFLMAANEMLRRSLVTNVFIDQFNRWRTNYTIGGTYFTNSLLNTRPDVVRIVANTPVRQDISITNIQIYHQPMMLPPAQLLPFSYVTNNEYSSALHRILQLAANIYDNMTNAGPAEPYFPSVWRPLYTRTSTNVIISGFVMDPVASTFPTDRATEEEFFQSNRRSYDGNRLNIYGQPVVIGAKKGWPNFNELSIETFIQVGRKLQLVKLADKNTLKNDATAKPPLQTNQMITLGLSNIFGIEAWNSYAKVFSRPIELRAQIVSDFQLTAGLNGINTQVLVRSFTNSTLATPYVVPANTWKGRKFISNGQPLTTALNISTNMNGDSDFRVPLYAGTNTLPSSEFMPFFPYFNALSPVALPTTFLKGLVSPEFILHMTNRVFYMAVDTTYNRIVDLVNIEKLVTDLNITSALGVVTNAANEAFGAGVSPGMFWDTNVVDKANLNAGTLGQVNQVLISLGQLTPDTTIWRSYYNAMPANTDDEVHDAIKTFRDWLGPYRTPQDPITNQNLRASTTQQAPFSPVRKLYLHTLYQVNDPFVHYMASDLRDPFEQILKVISPANTPVPNDELGAVNAKRYRPWGRGPNDYSIQDGLVGNSDDWEFPIAKLDDPAQGSSYGIPRFHYRYPNIGTLGRVHRGTPWQTVYLKAADTSMTNWAQWSGSWGTHPTTDWKLLDLFTAAMTENAARGLLSVNQTNIAAWSAVLSGVQVITNSVADEEYRLLPQTPPRFGDPNNRYHDLVIQPSTSQLSNIVAGINRWRATRDLGVFGYMGEILGTPELSLGSWPPPRKDGVLVSPVLVASPYLHYQQYNKSGKVISNFNTNQFPRAFTDDALEAIPQRVLSLLKPDETRVVIYSFGQALKPAPRSLATSANFYNLCLNYQVTGEYATKTVLRVEGEVRNTNNPVRTVIESFEQLPPFE